MQIDTDELRKMAAVMTPDGKKFAWATHLMVLMPRILDEIDSLRERIKADSRDEHDRIRTDLG